MSSTAGADQFEELRHAFAEIDEKWEYCNEQLNSLDGAEEARLSEPVEKLKETLSAKMAGAEEAWLQIRDLPLHDPPEEFSGSPTTLGGAPGAMGLQSSNNNPGLQFQALQAGIDRLTLSRWDQLLGRKIDLVQAQRAADEIVACRGYLLDLELQLSKAIAETSEDLDCEEAAQER